MYQSSPSVTSNQTHDSMGEEPPGQPSSHEKKPEDASNHGGTVVFSGKRTLTGSHKHHSAAGVENRADSGRRRRVGEEGDGRACTARESGSDDSISKSKQQSFNVAAMLAASKASGKVLVHHPVSLYACVCVCACILVYQTERVSVCECE